MHLFSTFLLFFALGWKRHRRNREENDKTISGSLRNRFVIPKGKHKKNQNSIELPLPLMEDDGKSGKQAKVKRFSMDEKGVLLFGGGEPLTGERGSNIDDGLLNATNLERLIG